ncbi:MAG: hypothetical protein NTX52_04040 [Planctomycetota bacterium]|nr:hypothetical protein [Planctomycetota bacterium]
MRKIIILYHILVFVVAVSTSAATRLVPSQYPTIQAAIDDANDGDTIIVQPGRYTGSGNRDIEFKGKAITVRSIDPNDPNIVAATIIDCNGTRANPHRGFYFHGGENASSIVAGLTITNGYGLYEPWWSLIGLSPLGGAIYCNNASPVITHCIIAGNVAENGGGIFCATGSPTINNCTFTSNSANWGGGMFNIGNSSPTVEGCTFSGNSAKYGGGMFNLDNSSPMVNGCTFSGNSAGWDGGGMFNSYNSRPTVKGCTFSGNASKGGGGIYNTDDSVLTNCILWGDVPCEITDNLGYHTNITYSDVQGGWSGEGNINVDPNFAKLGYWDQNGTPDDPKDDFLVEGDYHLKSQAGRWDPLIAGWIKDDVTSPCIDAGDPSSPIGLEPFPNGGIINMGAYGGTIEASKSYFGEPVCETIFAGDINGDCKVNLLDFALIALHWLEDNTPQPPGQASNPWPPDGAMSVYLDVDLSWTAGTNALSHDVYFGTDANALASADRMAPEYRGNRTFTKFDPELLNRYTTHYWRIDEICSGGITKGTVWRFTTGDAPPKGRTCFPADTLVWVDGALVEISKVVAGQMVGKTNCLAASSEQIEAVQEHEGTFECLDITLENGNTISVVDSHCFLLDSGQWAPVQKLTTGSKLKSLEGLITVRSIVKREKPFVGKVYNLRIKDTDWYLVGRDGIVVRDY